jgi:hypothetical protein
MRSVETATASGKNPARGAACPGSPRGPRAGVSPAHLHRLALRAAREAVVDMRASDAIGDDAFHAVEEQLDRLEVTIDGPGDQGLEQ